MEQLGQKLMKKYVDVTGEPDIYKQADQVPEWNQEFLELGFKQIGFLKFHDGITFKKMRQMYQKPDVDIITEQLTNGQIIEILTSKDELSFVTLELFFGKPLIQCHTILNDGAIIETTTTPLYLPKQQDHVKHLRNLVEVRFLQRLINWLSGEPVWNTEHHPRAGYYLEFMNSPTPKELWTCHMRRVYTITKKKNAHIPLQNSISLYMAIMKRQEQINQYRLKVQNWGNYFFMSLYILPIAYLLFNQYVPDHLKEENSIALLGILLFFFLITTFGLAWPRRIGPWIGRQLPFPRIVSLKETDIFQ